ncbi:MAG: S8 family serine peptidase [Bacteroidota bacterium]
MGFVLLATGSKAQDKYWVFFQDKGLEAAQFSAGAEKLLSPRAIARRARHGFTFSPADYPVSATYLRQLQDAGVQIHATSKWMNAASIRTALDYRHLQQACPAIVDMRPVGRYICTSHPAATSISQITDTLPDSSSTSFTYGVSANQLDKMELPCLHERGYTGEGVLVAVFDAGFYNVDTISAFDSTWLNNRVVSYYDFVDNDSTIFNESTHGLGVISTIIANRPGVYVGAAPHVSVVMARTENVFSETHQEEDDWLRAMEWADSIGVDIIQSSLGYNYFDTGEGDYTYQDMNGDTAIITRAADLAAARGILVVTSAGNEGNGSWRYITAPCDADSVLCVGSINPNDTRSSFSSVGPTADGRIKPDVVAMGGAARIINTSGNPGTGSGTSFAAPQIAGLVACLIQAHPNRSNMDVIAAVKQSADQFLNPDSLLGHGVPNACIADSILSEMDSLALESATMENIQQYVRIFPNPAEDILVLEVNTSQPRLQKIDVLNAAGARVIGIPVTQKSIYEIGVQDLPAGMYILRMDFGDGRLHSEKFIRQ